MKKFLTLVILLVILVVIVILVGKRKTTDIPVVDDMGEHEGESANATETTPNLPSNTTSPDLSLEIDPNAVVIDITGKNFEFSQKEIRVKKDATVVINFTSTDGFHDWVLDEFSAATAKVSTGGTTSVTFVADKVGTFEYYCSVGTHRTQGMVGKIIVE